MNENQKKIIILTAMLYELNEKRLFADEKSNEESFVKSVLENESTVDSFTTQLDIIELIRTIYLDDIILQRIMKSKRERLRRISSNIIKIEVRLELDDCEIKNELFWIKSRLYVFHDDDVFAIIFKQIHESSSKEHVDRAIIYDRVSIHYFWSRMTDIVARYVKNCHQCRRIKTYREDKQELLKSLSISKRYF